MPGMSKANQSEHHHVLVVTRGQGFRSGRAACEFVLRQWLMELKGQTLSAARLSFTWWPFRIGKALNPRVRTGLTHS